MISSRLLIETAFFLIFAVPLSIMDIRTFRNPLAMTFGGIIVFLVLRLFFPAGDYLLKIKMIAASSISSFVILAAVRIFSAGGLGKHNIIFGIFTSLYCPWWKNLAGLLFAALLGILVFLFLSFIDKLRKNQKILRPLFAFPFVSFICAGAVLSRIFFG